MAINEIQDVIIVLGGYLMIFGRTGELQVSLPSCWLVLIPSRILLDWHFPTRHNFRCLLFGPTLLVVEGVADIDSFDDAFFHYICGFFVIFALLISALYLID